MEEFNVLYEFIALAEKNRKYPANTAHGKRAALKLFETVLHADELQSIDLILERIEEIYLSLISRYKDKFSIKSLNTYKGRFTKVIHDYKKYGTSSDNIIHWEVKPRKNSNKDISQLTVSLPVHRGVHKLEIGLENGRTCIIEVPTKISKEDAVTIQKIIDSLLSIF